MANNGMASVCNLPHDPPADARTFRLQFDGKAYEIDLCPDHIRQLRKSIAAFAQFARPPQPGRNTHDPRPGADARLRIRTWAWGHGLPVSEHGPIPADIITRYNAAR